MELFDIHLADEVPAIGNGRRSVLAKEGRTWVTLLDWTTLRSGRISRARWESLRPTPCDLDLKTRRIIRRAMRRRLRWNPKTKLIKEALQ